MEKNQDQPAFAKSAFYHPDGGIDPPQTGLTKREYFAGLAMQSLISINRQRIHNSKEGCELAIQWADELLKQLSNTI